MMMFNLSILIISFSVITYIYVKNNQQIMIFLKNNLNRFNNQKSSGFLKNIKIIQNDDNISIEFYTNIKIGSVIRPEDPLYSVARGCLIAAENAK
jgi:hypothetical protein